MKKLVISLVSVIIFTTAYSFPGQGILNSITNKITNKVTEKITEKVNEKIEDTIEGTTGNSTKVKAKTTEQLLKEIPISNLKRNIPKNGKSAEITGIMTNKTGRSGAATVIIPCYDSNGSLLGKARDTTYDLDKDSTWAFSAKLFVNGSNQVIAKCDIAKIEKNFHSNEAVDHEVKVKYN